MPRYLTVSLAVTLAFGPLAAQAQDKAETAYKAPSAEEAVRQIKALSRNQIIIQLSTGPTVIDGLTSGEEVSFVTWPCKWDGGTGGGVGFVNCTRGLVDNTGCSITVPHEEGYCSRPCD